MFEEIKASPSSLSRRKPVCGVGINDSDYVTTPTINGKRVCCPYYKVWHSMIVRCYSKKSHKHSPTYIGCSVCNEWLYFSAFKQWMTLQSWENNELDKDILVEGNKIYSPKSCCFVPSTINSLMNDNKKKRGNRLIGATYRGGAKGDRYEASISIDGLWVYLGSFGSEIEASESYKKAKTQNLLSKAYKQEDERVKFAILRYAGKLMDKKEII